MYIRSDWHVSHTNFKFTSQRIDMKASVSFIYVLTIWVVEMAGADTPAGVGTIGNYRTAANGIVAYLPARYTLMPWAVQRVQNNAPLKVVSAYLPNQYASPESKPWALPSRFSPDTRPNVVAAYLPAQQYSSALPWRLPLQTSGARFS